MYDYLKNKYNSWYQNLRFRLSANNSPLFIGFYKYFYSPSKGGLNDFLNQYSKTKPSSFTVIQIGANDGMYHDPIHKYIKRNKWKGVLLEPQSYVYENFLSKIYQRNKGIHAVCAAIGEEDGSQKLYKIGFTNMRWATGLASFDVKQIKAAYDSGQVKKNCFRYGLEIPTSPSEQIASEDVDVISPTTLMKRYQISEIDLLQIDAEGFDYNVIRMFDIAKNKPKAIVFENMHLSEQDSKDCFSLLKSNDYAWQNFDANTLAMQRPLGDFSSFFKNN